MFKIVNKKNKKAVVDFKTNRNGKIEMILESYESEMIFNNKTDAEFTSARLGKKYEVRKTWK